MKQCHVLYAFLCSSAFVFRGDATILEGHEAYGFPHDMGRFAFRFKCIVDSHDLHDCQWLYSDDDHPPEDCKPVSVRCEGMESGPCFSMKIVFSGIKIPIRIDSIYRGYIWYDSAHSITFTIIKLQSNWHSRATPHTPPLRARYGVSVVSYTKKNDRGISKAQCIKIRRS